MVAIKLKGLSPVPTNKSPSLSVLRILSIIPCLPEPNNGPILEHLQATLLFLCIVNEYYAFSHRFSSFPVNDTERRASALVGGPFKSTALSLMVTAPKRPKSHSAVKRFCGVTYCWDVTDMLDARRIKRAININ